MNKQEQINSVAHRIDHAVLNPSDGEKEVIRACKTAKKFKTASICVKPSYIELAVKELAGSGIPVCTVIGFPHGGSTTETKLAEAVEALKNGACEIDMVINIGKLKDNRLDYVQEEIKKICEAVHKKKGLLKVIIENCLLDEKQKITACRLVQAGGADYIKTSTGFSFGGAEIKDIELMKSIVGANIKIKASGGIKNIEQAIEFINAGCDRLGTSKTENILAGKESCEEY